MQKIYKYNSLVARVNRIDTFSVKSFFSFVSYIFRDFFDN